MYNRLDWIFLVKNISNMSCILGCIKILSWFPLLILKSKWTACQGQNISCDSSFLCHALWELEITHCILLLLEQLAYICQRFKEYVLCGLTKLWICSVLEYIYIVWAILKHSTYRYVIYCSCIGYILFIRCSKPLQYYP